MKIFIPFSEALIEELGLSIGDLVPFQLEYECLRMNEGGHDADKPRPLEAGAKTLDPERHVHVGGDSVPEPSRTQSAPTTVTH